ncbi:hypothetical protein [Actinomadura violacea]|uniref:Uncharacterized protein n=1 Tax=Actinomadura violacea TaxID=2819934 RepID=A0ABS3RYM7_9ACTN|nr:hypothetical protein [Actinomadura violacea]MBO2461751.1 hypothetical protein [Actinomadura violacea]
MIPPTAHGRENTDTQRMALTMVRGFLPLRAADMPWNGHLNDPDADTALENMRAVFAGDEEERAMAATALGRLGAVGLVLVFTRAKARDVNAAAVEWLRKRIIFMSKHADEGASHHSEVVAARIVLALAPELNLPKGQDTEDAPAAVVALLDDDWWETIESLGLFAAEMFVRAFDTVEKATEMIDEQLVPLLA